jgi:protein-disulfide isomerase
MEPEKQTDKKASPNDLSIPLAIVFSGMIVAGAIIFTDKSASNIVAPTPQGNGAGEVVQNFSFPESVLAIKTDDLITGNKNADVVIIEYSDAECPFCQRFHTTMNTVMGSYGGSVAWVYRHFPLDSIHPNARKAGEALECANEMGGSPAFKTLADALFSANAPVLSSENMIALAASSGLDRGAFSTCLSSGKYANKVERDLQEGVSIGVEGTPFSIAWNKKTGKQEVINGAQSVMVVSAILDRLGAKK